MNRYGEQARRWWQQLAPSDYAAMQDPEAFFTTLGEQAAAEVADLMVMLAGRGSQEGPRNLQLRAEEIVRAELLMPPRYLWDPDPDDEPEPVDEQARLEACWAEEQRFQAEVEQDYQAWLREQEVHRELRARGWTDEKIREVGHRIDLSAQAAMAQIAAIGLVEVPYAQEG